MIDKGKALAVMGNHEFNAIAFATPDPDARGEYLRKHSVKNRGQTKEFLAAYDSKDEYEELIEWFRTLPLWLDLPGLRVVHACWDEPSMQYLEDEYPSLNSYLDDDLLVAASRSKRKEFGAVETLLKGKEIELPAGSSFRDKDGNERHAIRVKWWTDEPKTYREAFCGPETARPYIPDELLPPGTLTRYPTDKPPVFLGHYWMDGNPTTLTMNVACIDYSIASGNGGKLVAYRWDGELLSDDKFVYVEKGPD